MYNTGLPPIIVLTDDDRWFRFLSLLFLPPTEIHQAIINIIFNDMVPPKYGVVTAEVLPRDVRRKNVNEKDDQTSTDV